MCTPRLGGASGKEPARKHVRILCPGRAFAVRCSSATCLRDVLWGSTLVHEFRQLGFMQMRKYRAPMGCSGDGGGRLQNRSELQPVQCALQGRGGGWGSRPGLGHDVRPLAWPGPPGCRASVSCRSRRGDVSMQFMPGLIPTVGVVLRLQHACDARAALGADLALGAAYVHAALRTLGPACCAEHRPSG